MSDKCPVDHSTRETWVRAGAALPAEACPVDHSTRAAWLANAPEAIEESACSSDKLGAPNTSTTPSPSSLPEDREVLSIPRTNANANWIYPLQKQFFDAMRRKNWDPAENDMQTIVPIHNAVNERAWLHILMWERAHSAAAQAQCGGIKLTSFRGDLKKLTPRAWLNLTLWGYERPFDRHDWTVDRCGVEVPYVIDFYGGTGPGASFYLDVRPKLNSWEGFKLRVGRALGLA